MGQIGDTPAEREAAEEPEPASARSSDAEPARPFATRCAACWEQSLAGSFLASSARGVSWFKRNSIKLSPSPSLPAAKHDQDSYDLVTLIS
jgi:hypothetical protein